MNREDILATLDDLLLTPNAEVFSHIVRTLPYADLADALEAHPAAQVAPLLMTLETGARTALFAHLSAAQQDALLRVLPRRAVVALFEQLPSDDRADLFNRLNDEARQQLLPALAKVEREDILRLASYPEGSVGSVTTSDYATVGADLSVADALYALRTGAPDKETIYVVYVLDEQRHLLGTLSLRELVLARPGAQVAELMRRDPVFARAEWPAGEAAELIRRYDLLAVPVINGGDRMIGIVTVDDAMDIEKEQDTTQLARFGGTAALGGPDLDLRSSSFRQLFTTRVFWLTFLTVFGILTSTFVAAQEALLSQVIILAAFVAPIIDMGGNTGSQSATLVIRAMALGDIKLKWADVWFVLKRELPVAAALGGAIALLEAVLAFFAKGVGGEVLLVVGLTMLTVTILGGLLGTVLPFVARRLGTDPAALSAPLITSVMDLLGVFVYFGFAYMFLGHLLQ